MFYLVLIYTSVKLTFIIQKYVIFLLAVLGHYRTCLENTLTNRRFIYPNFFFDRCVVEIIAFSWSIVSMGEAMYNSAFLSFENCLNSVVVGSEAEHKFKNLAKY